MRLFALKGVKDGSDLATEVVTCLREGVEFQSLSNILYVKLRQFGFREFCVALSGQGENINSLISSYSEFEEFVRSRVPTLEIYHQLRSTRRQVVVASEPDRDLLYRDYPNIFTQSRCMYCGDEVDLQSSYTWRSEDRVRKVLRCGVCGAPVCRTCCSEEYHGEIQVKCCSLCLRDPRVEPQEHYSFDGNCGFNWNGPNRDRPKYDYRAKIRRQAAFYIPNPEDIT